MLKFISAENAQRNCLRSFSKYFPESEIYLSIFVPACKTTINVHHFMLRIYFRAAQLLYKSQYVRYICVSQKIFQKIIVYRQ